MPTSKTFSGRPSRGSTSGVRSQIAHPSSWRRAAMASDSRAGSSEAVVAPGECDVSAHVAVVRLRDDLPRVALVANDHAVTRGSARYNSVSSEDLEADEPIVHVDERPADDGSVARIQRLVQADERLVGSARQLGAGLLGLDPRDDLDHGVGDGLLAVATAELEDGWL